MINSERDSENDKCQIMMPSEGRKRSGDNYYNLEGSKNNLMELSCPVPKIIPAYSNPQEMSGLFLGFQDEGNLISLEQKRKGRCKIEFT